MTRHELTSAESPYSITPVREAVMDPLESLRTLLVVQERVVGDRLASLLAAAHDHPAAERVLAGIAVDTIEEKEKLDHAITDWAHERGESEPPRPSERLDLRDLLLSLLEVKRSSARRYRRAADAAPSPELGTRLRDLASQTAEHAAIILGLLADLGEPEPAPERRHAIGS